MEALGRETWAAALDFVYDQAAVRAMGDAIAATTRRAPALLRRRPDAGHRAARADRRRPRSSAQFADRLAGDADEQPASAPVRLLHPAAAADVDHGRAAAAGDQPGRRRLARRAVRCVRRGGGRPLAVRPRRLRRGVVRVADLGGVMANFMAMLLARDLHLGRLRGLGRPPRGADLEGARVYVSDQAHFSIARALDELGFPAETLVVVPSDDDFRLQAAPVADGDRRATGRPAWSRSPSRPSPGSTNTGSVDAIGDLADARRRRGPVAPRRRGLRRRRPPVGARPRSRAGPGPRGLGDGRSAQVVLPGLRHRRAAGPRRSSAGGRVRRPIARVLPRRRDADGRRAAADGRRARRPRRPAELLQARLRGHPALAGAQAVDVVEAPRHDRLRPARRGEHGPGRPPRGRLRGRRRLRGGARRAGAVGRLLPPPSRRPGRGRGHGSRRLDAHQDRLQAALEASGDGWLTTTRLRGAT